MVRPRNMGEEQVESDEEEQEIQILLTSRNPNITSKPVKWNMERQAFSKMKMTESMIDHLMIESRTVMVESEEGRSQISLFGVPQPLSETDEEREHRLELTMHYKKLNKQEQQEVKEEVEEVNKNQFYSTERGTQTKMTKLSEETCQTDPLPV